ncbi:MAG: hypothetical protein ACRBCT_04810 [Alphaproteobacteria bacterium]
MENHIFEVLLAGTTSLLSAIVAVIWSRADKAAKLSEQNAIMLEQIRRQVDKTNDLTERLSSLEASFHAEIKNLSVSIKRMENALIRIDQNANRSVRR